MENLIHISEFITFPWHSTNKKQCTKNSFFIFPDSSLKYCLLFFYILELLFPSNVYCSPIITSLSQIFPMLRLLSSKAQRCEDFWNRHEYTVAAALEELNTKLNWSCFQEVKSQLQQLFPHKNINHFQFVHLQCDCKFQNNKNKHS